MNKKKQSLKTKKYQNNMMLGPDGAFLCRCDDKKLKWYLDRDLAELVSEDPRTIKLLFEPNGSGHAGDPFYEQVFENKCVVCGKEKELTSHHIFPYCYRLALPHSKKSHNYHDVVALCVDCHHKYEKEAMQFKLKLAKKYNAPMSGVGYIKNNSIKSRKAAIALKQHQHKMPIERVDELRLVLIRELKPGFVRQVLEQKTLRKAFFGILFGNKKIKKLAEDRTSIKTEDFKTHGQILIEQLDENDLFEFIKTWRNHFLTKMKPRFMPKHWDINRPMWNNKS